MPSRLRTPKTLSEWIDLDGHRHPRLFAGYTAWLWGGAALGLILLVGVLAASGTRAFQAGPLSHPHALFAHDCGKCHEKAFSTLTRLWNGDGVGTVTNEACVQCHAGPPHHGTKMGRCADCHKEHRGHDALVRVDDRQCVECHAGMTFTAGGHPPFREVKDKGTINFNHAAHMSAPLPMRDWKQRRQMEDAFRTMGFDPAEANWPTTEPKMLACADCHQPDEAGRYMQPISHEKHCAACHPLGAQISAVGMTQAMRKQASRFSREGLDHPRAGLGEALVRTSLRDRLTRFILDPANAAFLAPKAGEAARHLPDRDPPAELPASHFGWVNGQVKKIEVVVFNGAGGCKYCHAVTPAATEAGLPGVAPPSIETHWRTKSKFRHDSHRMLNCVECHAAGASRETSDVLLPAMDTCLKCHDAADSTKARSGCMDCHTYHGHGKGWEGKLDIAGAGGR